MLFQVVLIIWVSFSLMLPNSVYAQTNSDINDLASLSTDELFDQHVATILQDNCIMCHNNIVTQGELNLSNENTLHQGGVNGDAIVPGSAEESLLYQLVTHQKKPYMPVGKEKLPPEEIAALAEWINKGAAYTHEIELKEPEIINTTKNQQTADIDITNIDFEHDIYPIFEQSCLGCHGPDKQNGMLRIDNKDILLQGGLSGPTIIEGQPEESLLVQRVSSDEHGPQMPVAGEKLTDHEIALIKQWIRQGASWTEGIGDENAYVEQHWAYVPPEKPVVPEVEQEDWVRNPIDNFILSKLNSIGLEPAPEADKETLIRRLYLDLTGLPPSPYEVDQFLLDESDNAYEQVVNKLLASPHYGERWATHWLDLARYADSNGYEKDNQREMWPYRDWVIDALNRDMPYDQFTIEQLAGDLLPGSNLDQKIATGFNRNTMINEEGGVNQEEYRVEAVIDRTNTTATVWMGTTMACAQCHNHKYDPISQEDYFSFYALFNNTEKEVDQVESFVAYSDGPLVEVPNEEQQQKINEIEPKLEKLKTQYRIHTNKLAAAQKIWEQEILAQEIDWTPLQPISAYSTHGAELQVLDDHSILAGGVNPVTDTYQVQYTINTNDITGLRLEFIPHESLPDGGPGRRDQNRFNLTEMTAYLGDIDINDIENEDCEDSKITFNNPTADWNQDGITNTIDGASNTGSGNNRGDGSRFEAVYLTDDLKNVENEVTLTIILDQWSGNYQNIGRFRFSYTKDDNPKANTIPDDVFTTMKKPQSDRGKDEQKELNAYFRSITPLLEELRNEIAELEKQLPKDMATVLVMRERDEPRQTHLLTGGSYLNPGKPVEPAIPALFQEENTQVNNRLDLARWLVSEENPLIGRVAVNRIWEQLFGYGIVKTTEDFGTRGEPPVNQELLDWLAIHYREQGWSQKSLLYTIVTSSAYRQDSTITPEKLEADPENRYLSRGPRIRLRAEFLRDNGLKISGLFDNSIGGPSVFPYQPEGIWQMPYSSAKWEISTDGDQYRRGLYTHFQRTAPYPMLSNFDAPSRELTCTRRIRTNTPLQALNLLNDPAYFEMAKALAYRMLTELNADVHERIRYGFRLCTARYPDLKELEQLETIYKQELIHFTENPELAEKILKDALPLEDTQPAHYAAWTMLANVLLNLDETITKN